MVAALSLFRRQPRTVESAQEDASEAATTKATTNVNGHAYEHAHQHASRHASRNADALHDSAHDASRDASRDDGEQAIEFVMVGDTAVARRPGSVAHVLALLGPDEHAECFLRWLREQRFPWPQWPRFGKQLWVPAKDLKEILYPEFVNAAGLPAHPWRTVAGYLRKRTDWRQKSRHGAGGRRLTPVEYLVRGKRRGRGA